MDAHPLQRFYANVAAGHGGPFDLTLDFGQKVGDGEPEYQARVAMSWEHAATLVLLIQGLWRSTKAKSALSPTCAR